MIGHRGEDLRRIDGGAGAWLIPVLALAAVAGCNNFKTGTLGGAAGGGGGGGAGGGGGGGHDAGHNGDASAKDGSLLHDASSDRSDGSSRDGNGHDGNARDGGERDGNTRDGGVHDGGVHSDAGGPVTIPTDHLLAYYPFNGNTNDQSGNGRNAVGDLVVLTADRFNEASKAYDLTQNSGNDWYGIISAPNVAFSQSFTLAAWIKVQAQGNPVRVVGQGNWVSLQFNASAQATFGLSPSLVTSSSAIPNDNDWHFLAGVANLAGGTTTLVVYLDGVMVGSGTFPATTLTNPGSCRFYMGNLLTGGTSANCSDSSQADKFPGDIDDVRVYGRALTSAEILALFHETA